MTPHRAVPLAGIAVLVAGAVYALYSAIQYIMGPGNGDEFLLATALSLVFVCAGNRVRSPGAKYRLSGNP